MRERLSIGADFAKANPNANFLKSLFWGKPCFQGRKHTSERNRQTKKKRDNRGLVKNNQSNVMIGAVLTWKPRISRLQLPLFSWCCVGINCCNAIVFFGIELRHGKGT